MKLKRVIRLDSMPITRASFTPEGFLMDTPILTCTGIFEYSNPDGSVRKELRLPEEVFSKESLASYEGSPIIISHDAGLITKVHVPPAVYPLSRASSSAVGLSSAMCRST